MKTLKDGGPAFPVTTEHGSVLPLPGISVRDYFAAATIQGTFANPKWQGSWAEMAEEAYQMADAMLAERAAENEGDEDLMLTEKGAMLAKQAGETEGES
jgi:hypothetical protein